MSQYLELKGLIEELQQENQQIKSLIEQLPEEYVKVYDGVVEKKITVSPSKTDYVDVVLPEGLSNWKAMGVIGFELRDSANNRVQASITQCFTMNGQTAVRIYFKSTVELEITNCKFRVLCIPR